MIHPEAMASAEELLQRYQFNWGTEVDFSYIPPGMTREKLVVVLARIVETGESLLVGWNQCFLKGRQP